MSEPPIEPRWIAVARLLRPQGRRGELLAEPLSDLPEIFVPGRQLRLVPTLPSARPVALTLESSWQPHGRNAGRLVLKLSGCDSITAAEGLEGAELQMEESALPALADDTFLVRDLLGCTLWDGSQSLGTVIDLQFAIGPDGRTRLADAPDLLVIQPSGTTSLPGASLAPLGDAAEEADTILVPFVKAWLDEVDLPGKQLRMHLPPGLFD